MGSSQSKSIKGGYRILKISEDSPASKCDLEIFFDYIVQIDGIKIVDASNKTYDTFIKKVRESENKTVALLVYNCRFNKTKEIKIIPQKWKGNGLLGININYEVFNALHEGTRIIDILENSPADNSDLVEQKDFIIGCEESILRSREDILNYVNSKYIEHIRNGENGENSNDNTNGTNCNNSSEKDNKLYITFYVYNIDTEKIRKVKLQPNKSWGGEGLLGCNIANGILHKVPLCKLEKLEMADKPNTYLNDGQETVDELQEADHVEQERHIYKETIENKTSIDNTKECENVNKNIIDEVDITLKAIDKGTNFENPKIDTYNNDMLSSHQNDALQKNEQNFTNEVMNNEMKQVNENDSIAVSADIEKENKIEKGEKIVLDKDHNFVKIKSGYSIILTSESDREDVKEKECNKESKVSEDVEKKEETNEVNGDNYLNYLKLMDMHSKELEEVCAGMNKNKEILSNLGITLEDETTADASCPNESLEAVCISKEDNVEVILQERYIENESPLEHVCNVDNKGDINDISEIEKGELEGEKAEDSLDKEYQNVDHSIENSPTEENIETKEANHNTNESVMEKNAKEINGTENTQNIVNEETITEDKINETTHTDAFKKNMFANNDGVDLFINDLPKAGIIYPTTDL